MSFFGDLARDFRTNRRVWTARRARPVPVRDARAGTTCRVVGRAVAASDPFRTPFSQRSVLSCIVRLEQKTLVDRGSQFALTADQNQVVVWREEIHEALLLPFWVVDDDGSRILVEPQHLLWRIPAQLVNEDPHVNDENSAFCTYLRRHGVLPTAFMGIAGETRFWEQVVAQGDVVSVFADLDEVQGVHAQGYRDAPERVLRARGTEDAVAIVLGG